MDKFHVFIYMYELYFFDIKDNILNNRNPIILIEN